jgi:hypothetical protein
MTSVSVVLRAVEEGSRLGFEKRQHEARLLAAGGKRCTQKRIRGARESAKKLLSGMAQLVGQERCVRALLCLAGVSGASQNAELRLVSWSCV